MLKRILVPLDTSEFTRAATRMAAHIANREQAVIKEPVTLTGLGLVDLDQIPTGRFAKIVPRDQIIAEAEQTVDGLIDRFRQDARALGLPEAQVETTRASGSPFRQIIRESVFCDMIVMGEQCRFPPGNVDYEIMHLLYHQASRPVMLTREDYATVDKVVIAMEGTAPASRMMYNYVHLEPFPRARVVLTYSRQEEEQYNLRKYYQRVEEYLTSYHIDVRSVPVPGDLREEIAGVVNEENAQVLAFGIHREGIMERLCDPLHIRRHFARKFLGGVSASLFAVH